MNHKYLLGKRPADYEGPMNYNLSEDDWPETDRIITGKQKLWDSRYQSLPWWRKLLHSLLSIDQGEFVHD